MESKTPLTFQFQIQLSISLDWKGREFWKNNPLEATLFSTQIAGEAIFKRIDQILHDYNPKQQDIALLYLFILALDFKGRYVDSPETCDHYRMHLYYFIHNSNNVI
jgi:type VI secretion system protein ImpK